MYQVDPVTTGIIKEIEVLRTLPELLTHHLERRPDKPIYKYFDTRTKEWQTLTVKDTVREVEKWKHAFAAMKLKRGNRVAMLFANCIEAILFDQAALACALTPVPLHAVDTPGSSSYILQDSGCVALFTSRLAKWNAIKAAGALPDLKYVVITDEAAPSFTEETGTKVIYVDEWIKNGEGSKLPEGPKPTDLAAIVYTSGTTGRPKGVMLTHRAILANIVGVLQVITPRSEETWLSFLPLSHTFERTASYYAALGLSNTVAFNRGIGLIQEDLRVIRPTILMSVPRIYEKIYTKVQDRLATKGKAAQFIMHWAVDVGYRKFCKENGLPHEFKFSSLLDPFVAGILDHLVGKNVRAIFGGRPSLYIAGGAAFNPAVSKFFLGLGVPIYQGYGMTETAPIIAVNQIGNNHPTTVGIAIKNMQVRQGENDELQVKGPNVMEGYWNRPEDTAAMFTKDGFLKTGDQVDIYEDGQIRIKGRIKEIIVTSTGEKIPPADLENAIETDPLFSQSMVVGDNRPYIAALVVANPEQWAPFLKSLHVKNNDEAYMNKDVRNAVLRRIKAATAHCPNYGIPRNVRILKDPWTIENGLLTPTLKLKRGPIRERFASEIKELYGER